MNDDLETREQIPTANVVDIHGGRHIIPVTEYRAPALSPYDRLIHGLGDETLIPVEISSSYDSVEIPIRVSSRKLHEPSHGAGRATKLKQ